MTKIICCCKDFYANMHELDCAVDIAYFHSFSLSNEFIHFRYCPWCGRKLKKKENFNEKKERQTALDMSKSFSHDRPEPDTDRPTERPTLK
jgi:hypothetical protein